MKKLFFACIPAMLLMSGTLFAQVDSDSTQLLDLEQLSVPPLEQDKAQPDEEEIQVPAPGRNQQIKEPSPQQSQQPKQQQQNVRPNQQPVEQQTIPPPQLQNPVRQQTGNQRQSQNPVLQTVPQQVQNPPPQQQQQLPQQQQQAVQPTQRQQQVPQPVQEQQQPVRQQIQQSPLMEERPVTSAPTNVKMTTPLISIDLIMDLYNKDIDFDIDYSGSTGAGVSNLGKKRPSEQEVQKMVTEQMDTTTAPEPKKGAKEKKAAKEVPPREDGTRPYTPEDANYNKAMISLNNAQQLFASRRYAEALAEINRSIAFAPNIALSYSVKGSVHYMLRQVSEAKRSWERALELDPTMDNVRAILLRMY
jgi:hypothetical protein